MLLVKAAAELMAVRTRPMGAHQLKMPIAMWVVLYIRVPSRVLVIRVPNYFGYP